MSSNAHKVEIDKNQIVNKNIRHLFVKTSLKNKVDDIISFIEKRNSDRGIIFCRTKAGAQNLSNTLINEGFSTAALEGNMQQKERDKVMRAFKNGKLQMIVATDLAARGLDIQGLSYVAHYTLPDKEEFYTHRSGRTARGGNSGLSISFVTEREFKHLKNIEISLGIELEPVSSEY